jgi:Thioredoxin
VGAVHVTYFTDPACPWSWAAEPGLRRLQSEFGPTLRITYVMGGLAREFRKPVETMHHVLDACAASGMPVDPRVWLDAPPRSSYPACQGVKAAAAQGMDEPYLRVVREGMMSDVVRARAAAPETHTAERRRVPFSRGARPPRRRRAVYDPGDPDAHAAAELWRLAAEWRVRADRVLSGELWRAA